jgi:hypothetical protein
MMRRRYRCPGIDPFADLICRGADFLRRINATPRISTNGPALAAKLRRKCTRLFRLAEETTTQIYLFPFTSTFD